MAKNKIGPVQVFMDRNSMNAMLSCLDYLLLVSDADWAKNAQRIKDKILTHGRKFQDQERDCVAIYFYENEAAVLIKAFSLLVFLNREPSSDYYSQIQHSKEN